MFRRSTFFLCFILTIVTVSVTSAQIVPGNMRGMLGAAFRDYRDGTSTVDYTLYTFDGAKVPVIIPEDVITAAGGFFALQESPVEIVLAPPTRDGKLSAAAIRPVAGPRWFEVDPVGTVPWTFLLCTFDNIAGMPISAADVETMTGNTGFGLGAYWSETSHGITTTDTTVYDWASIGRKRPYYTKLDPVYAVDAYLTDCPAAHGLTLSGSFNVAIAMNEQMFAQDFALGLYGFDGSTIQRAIFLPEWAITNHNIIAHEMGHSYGLPHSDNYDWDANPYDNPWDVMSDSFHAFSQAPYGTIGTPTNAFYYHEIGMLPDERVFSFKSIGSASTITIDDWMVDDSPNYQAAFIYPPNSNSIEYVVEVHKGTTGGFNSGYRPRGVPTDAVIIYKISSPDGQRPPVQLVGGYTQKTSYNMKSAWTVGETFTDTQTGISISVVAATENGFSIRVRQGQYDLITLTSPVLGEVKNNPNVAFTWNDVAGVAAYTIDIMRDQGKQNRSFEVPGGCGPVCTMTPDYAGADWKWKQGMRYFVRISGADSTGKRFAQSVKYGFSVRAFDSVHVTQPGPNATLTGSVLNVTFDANSEVEQYRLMAIREGKTIKTPWADYGAVCTAETCTMSIDLTAFPGGAKDGAYKFMMQARSALIADIVKTGKRSFRLQNG